jgi:hypothetical protein
MTKKIYRRFLLLGVMLVMLASLIYTTPQSQAARQDVCQECNDNCAAIYQSCIDQGYSFAVCSGGARRCSTDCLNTVCTYP